MMAKEPVTPGEIEQPLHGHGNDPQADAPEAGPPNELRMPFQFVHYPAPTHVEPEQEHGEEWQCGLDTVIIGQQIRRDNLRILCHHVRHGPHGIRVCLELLCIARLGALQARRK